MQIVQTWYNMDTDVRGKSMEHKSFVDRGYLDRFDAMEEKSIQTSFEKSWLYVRSDVSQQENEWRAEAQLCVQPRLVFNNR